MANRLIILLLVITSVLAYAVYEASKLDKKLSYASEMASAVTIRSIPQDLQLTYSSSGESFSFDSYTNRETRIFVHFWATWCGPCEVEFPELVEMINHFKNDTSIKFFLVAVNDDKKKVKKFLSKFKIDNVNVVYVDDKNDDYQKFGTYKMPESYLFNMQGLLIKRYEGQQPWSQEYIIKELQKK